jgi:opine dehydrogenase
MTRVAILGAGAGGAAAVAELTLAGHDVAFWGRSNETLAPFREIGGVEYEGVLGTGFAKARIVTTDMREALDRAEAIVIALPTFSHAPLARSLAEIAPGPIPIVLNPGQTGGALEFAQSFRRLNPAVPPVAEFSTLTYIARKYQPQKVTVTGRAKRVRAAALPGGQTALAAAVRLFPGAEPVRDVLAVNLANVNMVLHPPGAILGAAWVEARGGDFTFYVDGMTPGVARVMKALDDERRAVARAFGHDMPNLIEEMKLIGSVEPSVQNVDDFAAAIAAGEANRRIKAPPSLQHRYYLEDFGHGVLPFLEFAAIAGVAVPTAHALFTLAESLTGRNIRDGGRTAAAMGIAGLDRKGLVGLVKV